MRKFLKIRAKFSPSYLAGELKECFKVARKVMEIWFERRVRKKGEVLFLYFEITLFPRTAVRETKKEYGMSVRRLSTRINACMFVFQIPLVCRMGAGLVSESS